ncbi:MAG: DUF4224 domain-containing protein [Alphaproteobacteria bacterium]
MSLKMFLEKIEVVQLTGKKRRAAQKAVLHALGITFRETPAGDIKILREHVITEFGGTISKTDKTEQEYTPDWDALANA